MVNDVDQKRQRSQYVPARQSHVDSENYFDAEYDDIWPSRMPSSTRRYRSDVKTDAGYTQADVQPVPSYPESNYPITHPGRKSSVPARKTATQVGMPVVQTGRPRPVEIDGTIITRRSGNLRGDKDHNGVHFHWLVYVGIAMFVMTAGWIMLSMFSSWWQVTQDDWHYGRPRTFHIDAVVGHDDSPTNKSHFVAMNLNRHVEIIEFPGGDPTKAKVYIGPVLIGQGQDLAPVLLTFKDVNGDGKPDMVVIVQDSRFVFINENGAFRPPHPGENIHL